MSILIEPIMPANNFIRLPYCISNNAIGSQSVLLTTAIHRYTIVDAQGRYPLVLEVLSQGTSSHHTEVTSIMKGQHWFS